MYSFSCHCEINILASFGLPASQMRVNCCYHRCTWVCCSAAELTSAGSDASIGKCTCKNVSVVDYALVSSDLFPLISDFAVLGFCELYSDVHCPIVLKLNLIEAQETELGHFESDDDDCLEDADERNLVYNRKTSMV